MPFQTSEIRVGGFKGIGTNLLECPNIKDLFVIDSKFNTVTNYIFLWAELIRWKIIICTLIGRKKVRKKLSR